MVSLHNFTSLCRLCLKADESDSAFHSLEPSNSELLNKISVCLPVQISENDDLPKKICLSCSKSVDFVYGFWQLSSNSEKQLQNMLNNLKDPKTNNLLIEGSIGWQPDNSLVLYESLEEKDIVIACKDLNAGANSNVEIKEVYFGDYVNQNDFIEEDIESVVIREAPTEFTAEDSVVVPVEPNTIIERNTSEDTQISQIVESSNVSLQEWMAKNQETDMSTETFLDMILVKAEPKVEASAYACCKCGRDCSTERQLAEHARLQHKARKCLFCNKMFAQKYALESHLYVHTDYRRHPCSQCALAFKREVDLLNHVKRTHAKTETVVYGCDKCDYQSKNRFAIKVHLLAHDGVSVYGCDQCGKGFNSKMDLRTHQNNHVGFKPYQCDVCGNSFTRGPYLKQHRRMVHENPRSFKCDVCGRAFSLKSTLKNHLKRHTGENRHYTCDICGKTMSSRISLVNHQRIHSGDKRYSCTVCGKAYVTKLQVKRHAYIHTGDKPYKCDVCNKRLATGSSLIKHMQTHWENRVLYSCDVCQKSYISKYKLKAHIAHHHEERFAVSET